MKIVRKVLLLKDSIDFKNPFLLASIIGLTVVGTFYILTSRAATQVIFVEAESATTDDLVARKYDDPNASGGYIEFGQESSSDGGGGGDEEQWMGYTKPNAQNTGHISPRSSLTKISGTVIDDAWLNANNGGSRIVEGYHFTGQVTILADNVTLRDFYINGGRYGIYNGVFESNASKNLVIEDGEITNSTSSGIVASNATIRRLHIHHHGSDAIKPFSNVLIESNYISHLGSIPDSHADGVQMVSGSNVTVRGNFFDMRHDEPGYNNSQVIIMQTNIGNVDNILVEANWINGGGYSVQINDKGNGYGEPTNDRVINNRFGRDYQFGPLRTNNNTLTDRSGNVWDDTGQPI
ncbi:TPA: hypothetical protein EYO12_03440 [Candidatus Saccharibacteria bacterium]|nr:hypothetical protein [Candidatus Saccharibacteria bacterium]HIO87914.1 hypothetical protein [Candidatus Saccharibacteria bacterium]